MEFGSMNGFLDLPTYLPNENTTSDLQLDGDSTFPGSETTKVSPLSDAHQNTANINSNSHGNTTTINSDTPDAINTTTTPQKSLNEVIYIEGTNIALQTEEDIANWIAERRKRWPTRKNIELKEKAKNESVAAMASRKRVAEDSGPTKKRKTVCRFYQQQGRCRFGNKCKNSHEDFKPDLTAHTINGIEVQIPKMYSKRDDSLLFRNLVKQDQSEHENALVIAFIEFLDKSGKIDYDVMKKADGAKSVTSDVV